MTAPLPEMLRDLARRVDVRRAILPPADLAPALLAAAAEIEKQAARIDRQRQEHDAMAAQIAEHLAAVEGVSDLFSLAAARVSAMRQDAATVLENAEVAGPALRELLPLLLPWLNAATAARKALEA